MYRWRCRVGSVACEASRRAECLSARHWYSCADEAPHARLRAAKWQPWRRQYGPLRRYGGRDMHERRRDHFESGARAAVWRLISEGHSIDAVRH